MGASILVVDDDAGNRALARATLEAEGHRVLLATNGEEAIELILRERPACTCSTCGCPSLMVRRILETLSRTRSGTRPKVVKYG